MQAARVYHLVWVGGAFPDAYRLAVASAVAADPAASVRVHVVGDGPLDPALASLAAIGDTSVERVDPAAVFASLPEHLAGCREVYDRLPPRAASARSNLLRYALLYLHGGVYVDFDVVVLRPLHDLSSAPSFVGAERVWLGDGPRVAGRWGALVRPCTALWAASWLLRRLDSRWFAGGLRLSRRLAGVDASWSGLQANNAIIGAVPGSAFVDMLLRRATMASPTVRYATGPTLVHEVASVLPSLVEVLPPPVLYAVPPGESFRFFEDRTLELPPDAAAIHYVGSNHAGLLRGLRLDDPRFADGDAVFWRLGAALGCDRMART